MNQISYFITIDYMLELSQNSLYANEYFMLFMLKNSLRSTFL